MRPIKFSKKEAGLAIVAACLALASLRPNDPWVVFPMLTGSLLACIFLAVYHQGPTSSRMWFSVVAFLVLVFIGYRQAAGIYAINHVTAPLLHPRIRILRTQVFPFVVGQPMTANTFFTNSGDTNADIEGYTFMALVPSSTNMARREQDEAEGFRLLQENIMRGGASHIRVPPGANQFVTTHGELLTADLQKKISNHSLSLIFLGAVVYKDGDLKRETNYCVYNQGDPRVSVSCNKYNEEL